MIQKLFLVLFFLFHLPLLYSQDLIKTNPKLEDYSVQFNIGTRFGKVTGTFKKVDVKDIDFEKGKAEVTVHISSIDTGIQKRDSHLKEPDFFDIEKYPTSTFKISSIQNKEAKASLVLKGVTTEYSFPVQIEPSSADKEVWKGSINVNRKKHNINFDSIINPMDEVVSVNFKATIKYTLTEKPKTTPEKPVKKQ